MKTEIQKHRKAMMVVTLLIFGMVCQAPARAAQYVRVVHHLLIPHSQTAPKNAEVNVKKPGIHSHRHGTGAPHSHSREITDKPFSHQHSPNEPIHDHGSELCAAMTGDCVPGPISVLPFVLSFPRTQSFPAPFLRHTKPILSNLFRPPIQ